ncbi:MAG: PAS domain S-box protein [Gemmatimonadetes bacterium]|nr:PAS domain S-box protein [Gemmatimonadota bacterium]
MDRPRRPQQESGSRRRRGLRQLPHDRRIILLALLAGLPGVGVALLLLFLGDYPARVVWTVTGGLLIVWLAAAFALRARVVRPLQTLANMLAALREGDFSIRARLPQAGASDPLSLAYIELNALEEILREQRLGAVEATELLRKVLEEVDLAIFAFDEEQRLRLVNRAGARLLGQPAERLLDRTADELRLAEGLVGITPRTIELAYPGGQGRFELRRNVVRQEGLPLQLLVLSDLSRALREEERQAWKRIIRVLSHEINNSLAPITSITQSLQSLLERPERPDDIDQDLESGLGVIRGRADSLGRFMAAYARLARLPEPVLAPVRIESLVEGVAALETRLPVVVMGGPDLVVQADADQLEQALINLIRNATDATLGDGGPGPSTGGVQVRWILKNGRLHLMVEDEGPGVSDTANLFVPFYTTKPGGSGIGLVLSRQIAEGHGGKLELENRSDGPGARARLTLPTDL